jgi:hypothetical protein
MSLTWLLAVIAFVMSVIFSAWSIHHGVWSWQFFMLWGLLLWCVSGHAKAP